VVGEGIGGETKGGRRVCSCFFDTPAVASWGSVKMILDEVVVLTGWAGRNFWLRGRPDSTVR